MAIFKNQKKRSPGRVSRRAAPLRPGPAIAALSGLMHCAGLVLPQVSRSKADMVIAGVVPIDQLVDVRGPVQAIADKLGLRALDEAYGLQLSEGSPTGGAGSASDVLSALALSRGWTQAGGLPDETRAGRQMCKDYVNGKLLYCEPPPESKHVGRRSRAAEGVGKAGVGGLERRAASGAGGSSGDGAEVRDSLCTKFVQETRELQPSCSP